MRTVPKENRANDFLLYFFFPSHEIERHDARLGVPHILVAQCMALHKRDAHHKKVRLGPENLVIETVGEIVVEANRDSLVVDRLQLE